MLNKMNWSKDTIMEFSDDNKFEFFNDTQIKKVRLLYVPDENDESKNIKTVFNYNEFQAFLNAFSDADIEMTENFYFQEYESLKNLLSKITN